MYGSEGRGECGCQVVFITIDTTLIEVVALTAAACRRGYQIEGEALVSETENVHNPLERR